MALLGAIEAGGTKFLCALGEDPAAPRDIQRFSTSPSNPAETMAEVVRYFESQRVAAVGVASFGPLDLASGSITNSPKLAWQNYPLGEAIATALNVPVAVDTDVNGAALGEAAAGAGRGVRDFVYITVGTGIGGGALVNGKPLHGAMHPEMGHLILRPHPQDSFKGVCPFHGACLEGLASGPAMKERWGQTAELLPDDHLAWEMEAHYLAQACASLACILSPSKILLGGGVMGRAGLLEKVHRETIRLLNGYLRPPEIVAPTLPYPALSGALAMARAILEG